jgi:hypothetical protein
MAGSCEHGNKPSGFFKVGEFIDQINDCYLLKNGICSIELFSFKRVVVTGGYRKLYNNSSSPANE